MRCPKCHYISFEAADRCRNCGYDFSLTPPAPVGDALPLQDRDDVPLPPMDLSLAHVDGLHDPPPERDTAFDLERIAGRPAAFDLPLFGSEASDAPLVKSPAVPRPPLAVRRATPDMQRLRSRHSLAELPNLELEPEVPVRRQAQAELARAQEAALDGPIPAPAGRRVFAGLIDLLIVGAINLGVLYFTLRLCGLQVTADGLLALPPVPVIVFLLMLDGGYVVAFTAIAGQTIGKMATGLRVVRVAEETDEIDAPNLSLAILRTAAYAASLLPVGLGFVPALFGHDRRALHDRLAETKVVKI